MLFLYYLVKFNGPREPIMILFYHQLKIDHFLHDILIQIDSWTILRVSMSMDANDGCIFGGWIVANDGTSA